MAEELDLLTPLEGLWREMAEFEETYRQSLVASNAPDRIYHYTDDAGLRGIVQSGKLWFTDVNYLNDPSEITYGMTIAADILAAKTEGHIAKLFVQEFSRHTKTADAIARNFVCSFSKKDNDLEQWRGYANNGCGYAIGFDGQMLETAFTTEEGKITERLTFPVSYDETKLRELYNPIIDKFIPYIEPSAEQNEDYQIQLRMIFLSVVNYMALFFKHSAYENEKEYRFMHLFPVHKSLPDYIKYRTKPNMLLPYFEFSWRERAEDALTDIVIGPAISPELGFRFVDDCLRAYYPTAHPRIRPSGIPYRPS